MKSLCYLALTAFLLTPLGAQAQISSELLPPPVGPAWKPSEIDVALKYAKESRFDLAFPIFKKHAEAGDLEAMYHLGIMYHYGEGMNPDQKAAFAWTSRSAKGGYAPAQNDLGAMYVRGDGTKP